MKVDKIPVFITICGTFTALLAAGCSGNPAAADGDATFAFAQPQNASISAPAVAAVTSFITIAPSTAIEVSSEEVAPWDLPTVAELADFTPAQLWSDYKNDPVAADARYYGRTFIWKNVVIDDMATLFKPCDAVAYVLNGLVYFRTDNKTDIQDLKVGYVVDIQGTVMGPLQNFVLVEHCKYTIQDTTNGVTRPDWITVFA